MTVQIIVIHFGQKQADSGGFQIFVFEKIFVTVVYQISLYKSGGRSGELLASDDHDSVMETCTKLVLFQLFLLSLFIVATVSKTPYSG